MEKQSGNSLLYIECRRRLKEDDGWWSIGPSNVYRILGQTVCKNFLKWLWRYLLIGTAVWVLVFVLFEIVVRSDQGGSRNLFSEYENANKPFHVTLVIDDGKHSSAHKRHHFNTERNVYWILSYLQKERKVFFFF